MNSDTIQIWHGNISSEDADYPNYWRVLDADEQARAGKFKNDLLRKRFVEVHGRLRKLLAQILNESPEKINIKTAEHGKPYLVDTPELAFNLSHSADAMVIAVGLNCQLGVDIEFCKSRTSLAGLVDKCFAEEEIAYWNKLPEAQQISEFYRFWTRKEAFVKATGRGIGLGLNLCVVNPENPTGFLRVPEGCGEASIWHVQDIALGQGVCGTLVTDKDIVGVRLIDFAS
ncbi:MAG: 4'-phosphopantetheinyl transferase superfamily protein [Methylobacter sp.]|nr:4'-phosphopantetheinyl transferase superfamily protein [Methylobacter sp.]